MSLSLSFLICEMGITLLLYRTAVENKWVNCINSARQSLCMVSLCKWQRLCFLS